MGSYDLGAQDEFLPKARAAALEAVRLDDSLAEAHTALALIAQNYDWDWQKAGKEYRRAIRVRIPATARPITGTRKIWRCKGASMKRFRKWRWRGSRIRFL